MIVTRKIQIYVSEPDKVLKKEFVSTIYQWRDLVRKTANIIVSHKFVQQNVRDFIYIKDAIQDKFYVKDILKEGKGMSEQNTTYRVASDMLKGKVPSDIYTCLNQAVSNTFKETVKDIRMGNSSLRSYKNNIPIPFSSNAISNIHWDDVDNRYYFTLFGIPFATFLGLDRSNNSEVIDYCISGEYKMCSSSFQIDDNRKKIFLLLCVDMPKKQCDMSKDKEMDASLDIDIPISVRINEKHVKDIGTREEFLHRRLQIQESLRRCQISARYSGGGRGRKRKLQSIDRFHEKEKNYIDTKLHIYSNILINLAVRNKCATINLVNQKKKEDIVKDNEFLLRNWSYYGLKTKIEYKAKKYGIDVREIEI